MRSLPLVVQLLSLGLALGSAFYFSFFATTALFAQLTRDEAARAVSALFPGYFRLSAILLGIAVLATIWRRYAGTATMGYLSRGVPARLPDVALAAASLALLLALLGGFYILPQVEAIQARIPSFSALAPEDPLRREWGMWHGISLLVNLVAIAVSAVAFLAAALAPR